MITTIHSSPFPEDDFFLFALGEAESSTWGAGSALVLITSPSTRFLSSLSAIQYSQLSLIHAISAWSVACSQTATFSIPRLRRVLAIRSLTVTQGNVKM